MSVKRYWADALHSTEPRIGTIYVKKPVVFAEDYAALRAERDSLQARLAEVIAERDSIRTMLLNERTEWMDEAIRRQASVNQNLAALVTDGQEELRKCQQDAIQLQARLAHAEACLAEKHLRLAEAEALLREARMGVKNSAVQFGYPYTEYVDRIDAFLAKVEAKP